MGISKSFLTDILNFERKIINKEEFYIDNSLVLKFEGKDKYKNLSTVFLKEKNELFTDISDVHKLLIYCDFLEKVKFFQNGLPEKNINQGNFSSAYTENDSDIPKEVHDKNKKLCEAIFNYFISDALTEYNGEKCYDFKILECKFDIKKEKEITTTRFSYNCFSTKHDYDFSRSVCTYNFSNEIYELDHSCNNFLTDKHFLDSFV